MGVKGSCVVCIHEDRQTIDGLLLGTTPHRRIAEQIPVSLRSLSVHKANGHHFQLVEELKDGFIGRVFGTAEVERIARLAYGDEYVTDRASRYSGPLQTARESARVRNGTPEQGDDR